MTDTSSRSFAPLFLTSVFQWPRRTLVRHIGFPGRAYEDHGCRRVPAAASPCLRNQAAMHSLVNLLLQWLCHVPSIPCCTVIFAAMHLAGLCLTSHVDSDLTRAEFNLWRIAEGSTRLQAWARSSSDYSQPRFAAWPGQMCRCFGPRSSPGSGCPICRKLETRRFDTALSVARSQACGLRRCVA
jgi:hypothetical protein